MSRGIEVTVFRTGTFNVAAPEVEDKCGIFGKTEFRYDVWFTAGEDDLDDRGFIVDNADLHRYFQKKYGDAHTCWFTSCEVMSIQAIKDFREAWPMARAIKVQVWGKEEITYVEANWRLT